MIRALEEKHDEVVLLYKEHIMRLEFEKEDLKQENLWWRNKVFPVSDARQAEYKPVHNRMSIGRARNIAEHRNQSNNNNQQEKK